MILGPAETDATAPEDLFASGCAFRSFLPGSECQRICLSDSALSSVLVTRSVATLAELSLVAQ